MNIERDFIERRRLERRAAINAGIVALVERRDRERRGDNSRIADWLARFDELRGAGDNPKCQALAQIRQPGIGNFQF